MRYVVIIKFTYDECFHVAIVILKHERMANVDSVGQNITISEIKPKRIESNCHINNNTYDYRTDGLVFYDNINVSSQVEFSIGRAEAGKTFS